MSGETGLFLEACGASGPLRLEWAEVSAGKPSRRAFERPAVLIGRGPEADVVLDHPRIGLRHAYLQMVEGRLFAFDLGTREGLRWDGVPRLAGWVDRRRPLQIGPVVVRVVAGDRSDGEVPKAGPGPTSRRFESQEFLPEASLEMRGAEGEKLRCPLERVLTLVGGSERCHLRLSDPVASRFVCALVRTPAGVWVVDLLSSRRVLLNGVVCRNARLEDGDALGVGTRTVRLRYGGERMAPRHGVESVLNGCRLPNLIDQTEPPAGGELPLEVILRPLLEQAGPIPQSSSPFGQALVMLIRLLGEVHRDHLGLVREELAQIRILSHQMRALREQRGGPDPGAGESVAGGLDWEGTGEPRPDSEATSPTRLEAEFVEVFVGERIAAWERETKSRWRKVLGILAGR